MRPLLGSCTNTTQDCYQPWYNAERSWTDGDRIQANFVAQSTLDSAGDDSAVVALVQNQLKSNRSGMLAVALNEITNANGQIYSSVNILDGAKVTLDSFVNLGMSKTIEADDLLRSLLFGNERLPDSDVIASTYAIAIGPNANPPRSISDAMSDLMHSRSAALSDQIHKILDRIETDKTGEPLRGVSTTLQQLEVFRQDVIAHHPNP